MTAVRLLSNEYWGRRSGKYDPSTPKGSNQPWGNCFQQIQFGSGPSRNRKQPSMSLKNVNKKWFK